MTLTIYPAVPSMVCLTLASRPHVLDPAVLRVDACMPLRIGFSQVHRLLTDRRGADLAEANRTKWTPCAALPNCNILNSDRADNLGGAERARVIAPNVGRLNDRVIDRSGDVYRRETGGIHLGCR